MTTISHAIRIRAPRDEVFDAITTTEGLEKWYAAKVTGDLSRGKEIAVEAHDGVTFRWRMLDLTPSEEVKWECLAGPGSAAGTYVVHRLYDTHDGRTAVEVDHDGWDEADDLIPTCNTLWGILIGRLRDYAESGETPPAFT